MTYEAELYDAQGTWLTRMTLPEPIARVYLPVTVGISSWQAPTLLPSPVKLVSPPVRIFRLDAQDHEWLTYREIGTHDRVLQPSKPRTSYDVETSTNEDLDTWILAMKAEVQRRRVGR